MSEPSKDVVEQWLANKSTIDTVPPALLSGVPLQRITSISAERHLDVGETYLLEHHAALREMATMAQVVWALTTQKYAKLELGRVAVEKAATSTDPAAVPFLARMVRHPDWRFHQGAAKALVQQGTPEARRALRDLLAEGAIVRMDMGVAGRANIVVNAVLAEPDGYDALLPFFEESSLSTEVGRSIALKALHGPADLRRKDPRWLALTVARQDDLRLSTRHALAAWTLEERKAAGYEPKRPPPPAAPVPSAAPPWLKRYQAGEHEVVWAEMTALGAGIRDKRVVDEASAVARATMDRVQQNLSRIAEVLRKKKYAFSKTGKKALPGADPKVAAQIKALEKRAGAPLPLSLRAFYEVVGPVDFTEKYEATYTDKTAFFAGYGKKDPIMVESAKLALGLAADYAAREAQLPQDLRRPLQISIGLDPERKAENEGSNDEPWEMEIEGHGADGILHQAKRSLAFVVYLRRSIGAGGFLGLADDDTAETAQQRELLGDGFVPF
jgi:hypothetical protein